MNVDLFSEEEKALLQKLISWCMYRERSVNELISKMDRMLIESELQNQYLSYILLEKYLNQNRFIEEYIHGKFNVKRWGRGKIIAGLLAAGIDVQEARQAVESQIQDLELIEQVKNWILKKESKCNWRSDLSEKWKVIRFLKSKGFNMYEINQAFEELSSIDS